MIIGVAPISDVGLIILATLQRPFGDASIFKSEIGWRTRLEVASYILQLKVQDVCRLAFIGYDYFSDKSNDKTFVCRQQGASQIDSDRQCRSFCTLSQDFGAASSTIQVGDLLCFIHYLGYCIIRKVNKFKSFILVSQAVAADCFFFNTGRIVRKSQGAWHDELKNPH